MTGLGYNESSLRIQILVGFGKFNFGSTIIHYTQKTFLFC